MQMKITNNSKMERIEEQLISTQFGEELMMMDLRNGDYVNVSKTGAIIWEMLEEPKGLKDIVHEIQQRFEVNREDCENDVKEYITSLLEKGYIKLTN